MICWCGSLPPLLLLQHRLPLHKGSVVPPTSADARRTSFTSVNLPSDWVRVIFQFMACFIFNNSYILMFCISYCRIWLWGGGASVLLSQPIKEKETVGASVWPRPQSALFNCADRQGSPSSHDWLQGHSHFYHFIWISYCRTLRKSYCVATCEFFWSCQQPNIRTQLWC